MLNTVKLANGTVVTWEEFSKWSSQKQRNSLLPPSLGHKATKEESENRSKAQKLRHIKNPTSEETKQKISEKHLNKKRTDEHKEAMRKGWEKLKASGWTSKKKGEPLPSQWKRIVTPNGIFPSKKALAERIQKDLNLSSVAYANQKVGYWLKKYPNDYYYEKSKV
jgi:hypothetical protein